MTFWDDEGPPRERNIEGLYAFWGVTGRMLAAVMAQIGRASCRERVCQYV